MKTHVEHKLLVQAPLTLVYPAFLAGVAGMLTVTFTLAFLVAPKGFPDVLRGAGKTMVLSGVDSARRSRENLSLHYSLLVARILMCPTWAALLWWFDQPELAAIAGTATLMGLYELRFDQLARKEE